MKVNQSKLNRIMKYYTLTTMILMLFLPLLVTGVIFIQKREAIQMDSARVSNSLTISINERNNEVDRLAQTLTSNSKWEEELNRYFTESYTNHHTYYLMNGARGVFLPNEIARIYANNRYINNVQMVYRDANEVFVSTRENYLGRKQQQLIPQEDLIITAPLRSSLSFENIGTVLISYSLEKIVEDIVIDQEGMVVIYDPINKRYSEVKSKRLSNQQENIDTVMFKKKVDDWKTDYYLTEQLAISGHQVLYLIPKDNLTKDIIKIMMMIFLICGLTAGVISYYIFSQLKNYAMQVEDILDTTSRIKNGQIYYRVNENDKDAELKQITQAINSMLDGQQESLKQVYQLQMQNNEAVLKALQAQINPHFLYNTLEFIRMSAYIEGAEQLAEFVYDFSILMRNNITDEKEKTIAEEIYFIQKYINLYQARYPGKLSVYLEIDDILNEVRIPKFTLQPLVENYLVHGVDFSENNNELTISMTNREKEILIEITDNGRGINEDTLSNLNRVIGEMIQSPFQFNQTNQRLGVAIVAQRLGQYFGPETKMYYENNQMKGVTVWIHLPHKENTMF